MASGTRNKIELKGKKARYKKKDPTQLRTKAQKNGQKETGYKGKCGCLYMLNCG